MLIIHGIMLLATLIIVSRLIELQIIKGSEYRSIAEEQHFGGVKLAAKRGEIMALDSKTGVTSIFATNTTLNMVYVDPLITEDPVQIAETLSDILVTEQFHQLCKEGNQQCPRELVKYFEKAFDPLERVRKLGSGFLLEPLSTGFPLLEEDELPDQTEVRRQFARDIENRISEKRVTFVPLVYSATKVQMEQIRSMDIPGVYVEKKYKLIHADPESIPQERLPSIAKKLSGPCVLETDVLKMMLRSRHLRYVPVMRRLPPQLTSRIREAKIKSFNETIERKRASATREIANKINDPLRSIALLPEHWRFYPDSTIASHVVGFLNTNQEPQYGIERTFNPQLRGQEGLISTMSDPQGGQILTAQQTIIDPKDGDTITLTIDRIIQKKVEGVLEEAVKKFQADSAQAIIMEPYTGRIIAMANAPLFNSNDYGTVYLQEPIYLDEGKQKEIVVELYHPETRKFVVKAYLGAVFTDEGRSSLSTEKRQEIDDLENLYDLKDIVRYYLYIGENSRREIFPTERRDIWLKYTNNIGVGAYLNRTIQEIYEPGSVMKPITMSAAIDQGEVVPDDKYDDVGPVEVDEYTIRNALNNYFGEVTMTNCLEYSINTCMTTVSTKLGRKLFHRMLERFGFGKITGIELEDELPGEILPWRKWSNALLATSAYGQGISATPLQVVTAFAVLANGGKLVKPTIIDSIVRGDGKVEKTKTRVIDQVITKESAETVTAMLVSGVNNGFGKNAKVPGYMIAGKTGTSQIAGPGGKYEAGTGSTLTSFVGYAPADNPKFVMLVKFDRPRAKDIEYGSQTGAPVFKEIADFLFEYYGIPPDEE